jgi:hypothetical protein
MKSRSAIICIAIALSLTTACQKQKEKESGQETTKETKKPVYTCSMHPEVESEHAGKCPKCGMDLEEKK